MKSNRSYQMLLLLLETRIQAFLEIYKQIKGDVSTLSICQSARMNLRSKPQILQNMFKQVSHWLSTKTPLLIR
jgi:hypothetical protein